MKAKNRNFRRSHKGEIFSIKIIDLLFRPAWKKAFGNKDLFLGNIWRGEHFKSFFECKVYAVADEGLFQNCELPSQKIKFCTCHFCAARKINQSMAFSERHVIQRCCDLAWFHVF